MHLFSIFMPHVAAELISQGFKIVKTEPNKKNPQYVVYKFEDTPEFQLALKKILERE